MNKTAEYNTFEEGFLKEAAAAGCDVAFLRGYIKQADEIVELWKNAFDELAERSGDTQYKIKLANELVYFTMVGNDLVKQAAGEQYQDFLSDLGSGETVSKTNDWLKNQAGGLGDTISNLINNNPNLLPSLAVGGGGGGLIGLLLGALTGHPMIGLMLGGLTGAGASAYLGNKGIQNSVNNKYQSLLGKQPSANQNNPAPQPAPASASPPSAAQPIPSVKVPVPQPMNTNNVAAPK